MNIEYLKFRRYSSWMCWMLSDIQDRFEPPISRFTKKFIDTQKLVLRETWD